MYVCMYIHIYMYVYAFMVPMMIYIHLVYDVPIQTLGLPLAIG
jgi:hypothetical protein